MRVAGFGQPFALDYGAIILIGNAREVDGKFLSEVLPLVSKSVVSSSAGDEPITEE